jgi:hypothetical protein
MKTRIIFLTVAFTLVFCACNNSSTKQQDEHAGHDRNSEMTKQIFNLDTAKLKPGDTFFQCEMDKEVISDKPGNCPKCNMKLNEMKKSQ